MKANAETHHLSHSFRTDAAHLIEKVRHANSPKAPHLRTSYIAKLVVDAYMACECALKSMIASANADKTGTEVYGIILKRGHNLKRLIAKALPQSIDEDACKFLKVASKHGVSLRYSLDLFSLTTSDSIQGSRFQIDQNYLREFLKVAKSLTQEAEARHRSIFGNGGAPVLTNEQLKEYVREFQVVSKKQITKC